MKKQILILLIITNCFTISAQQSGCTDSAAINFDPKAVLNDGSCRYKPVAMKLPVLIRRLPKTVIETSGLIFWRDSYWTHNDSDNKNELYRLDAKNGKIIQTIAVANADNYDWEEVTQDDDFIYIGDFGNNLGNRMDLKIYKIVKSAIPDTGDASVMSDTIAFAYGDQEDFSIKNLSNDYDCEAMIAFGDSLFIFTKNWVSGSTRLYALTKTPGNYTIYPADEFDVNGLITGAAYDKEHSQIVLIGYRNYFPFVWRLWDFKYNDFFGGNKRRYEFRELFGAQTEAITYTSGGVFVISCEKTPIQKTRLFEVKFPTR